MRSIHITIIGLISLSIAHGVLSNTNVCHNVANGIFLANLTDCSRYIVCMNNTAYSANCPEPYLFNSQTQKCDYSSNVNCYSDKCTNMALSTHAYAKTCSSYILCYAGVAVMRRCVDGLEYNSETDRCDFANRVDCQDNMCNPVNDPNNIVFLPSHAKCDSYYICYGGAAKEQRCAKGLQYNEKLRACDFKGNVNCTISAAARGIIPLSKTPPVAANIACPPNGSHFYNEPNNPEKYIICMNGRSAVLSCTPGLIYDDEFKTCRQPEMISSKNAS